MDILLHKKKTFCQSVLLHHRQSPSGLYLGLERLLVFELGGIRKVFTGLFKQNQNLKEENHIEFYIMQ
jgi:hypothetical protein